MGNNISGSSDYKPQITKLGLAIVEAGRVLSAGSTENHSM
jgi:hypothetical protein